MPRHPKRSALLECLSSADLREIAVGKRLIKEFVTLKEAAALLGKHEKTIYARITPIPDPRLVFKLMGNQYILWLPSLYTIYRSEPEQAEIFQDVKHTV